MTLAVRKCKCGLKDVPATMDFSWFWESHNVLQCTQQKRIVVTTPPVTEFEDVETIYRMKNCTALHRRNDDMYDYKIVYHTGDTVYFNPDRTVNYVVDSAGRPWW